MAVVVVALQAFYFLTVLFSASICRQQHNPDDTIFPPPPPQRTSSEAEVVLISLLPERFTDEQQQSFLSDTDKNDHVLIPSMQRHHQLKQVHQFAAEEEDTFAAQSHQNRHQIVRRRGARWEKALKPISARKRSIRRCGMLLIRHIQAVCNGCLKGASDSEAVTIAKRAPPRLKKDLSGFAKITDMCCTQRSCTDEEIQPLCC